MFKSEKFEPVLRTNYDWTMGVKFDTPEEARVWAGKYLTVQYRDSEPEDRPAVVVYRHLVEEI